MSNLSVTEFQFNGQNEEQRINQIVRVPPIAGSNISYASASVQSNTFNPLSRIVRVSSDTSCRIAFGLAPTADQTTSLFLPAGVVEYFGIPQNSNLKIAVIASL